MFKLNHFTQHLLIAIGFIYGVVIFRLSAIMQINTAYLGGYEGDAGLYIWLLKANCRDLFSLPWFDTMAFYPYHKTLAYSDNFIFPSMVACPFIRFGAPVIIVYNAILLAAQFLNGFCSWLFLKKLNVSSYIAFAISIIFMVFMPFSAQLGHPQLHFLFFLPLTLYFFISFLQNNRFIYAYLTGITVFLVFLTTVYYAIFIACVLVFAILCLFITKPFSYIRSHYKVFCLGSIVGVLPIIFFLPPYFSIRETFGGRSLLEPFAFAANGLSYLSSSTYSWYYAALSNFSHAEAKLFPGIVVYILLVVCLLNSKRYIKSGFYSWLMFWFLSILTLIFSTKGTTLYYPNLSVVFSWAALLFYIIVGIKIRQEGNERVFIYISAGLFFVFLIISLGPIVLPADGGASYSLFTIFYNYFPGFNSIRAVSRSGIFVLFFLLVFIAQVLPLIINRKWNKSLLVLLFIIAIIEQRHPIYQLQTATPPPGILEKLKNENKNSEGVILFLPWTAEFKSNGEVKSWGNFAIYNVNYMNWGFETGAKIINGYSGQRTKMMRESPGIMQNFPDERSIEELKKIDGLKYVAYVARHVPNFDAEEFNKKVTQYSDKIQLIEEHPTDSYLFSIK